MSAVAARECAAGSTGAWGSELDSHLPPAAGARPTLLVTTVDIGEGRSGRIEIREGDDPTEVAWAFCQAHGLSEAIIGPLAAHLQDNIDQEIDGTDMAPCSEPALARGSNVADEGQSLPQQQQVPEPAQAAGQQERYEQQNSPAQQPHEQEQYVASYQQPQQHQQAAGQDPATSFQRKLAAHRQQQHAATIAAHHLQQTKQAGLRLERSRSQPTESPSKGGVDGSGMGGSDAGDQALTFRPASSNSAISAAYFGGRGGGGASARMRQLGYEVSHGGGGDVGERLYREAFRKQARLEEERRLRDLEIQLRTEQVHVTPVSQELAKHRTQGAYTNYGERLYAEGRIEAMRKAQEAAQLRKAEEEEELVGVTFRPEISHLAKALKAQEAAHVGGGLPAYERLYYKSATAKRQVGGGAGGADAASRQRLAQPAGVTAKTQERMEIIRRDEAVAAMAECTFAPRINDRSVRMVSQRQRILKDSGIAPCEQLYNDSMRRQLKQEAAAARLPEEVTFHPHINRSSVVLRRLAEQARASVDSSSSIGMASTAGGASGGDVAARLLERGRRYQAKLDAARSSLVERPVDPATGRPLFQPETCRPPRYQRNPDGLPVGEYLYSIKSEWDERAAAARHATDNRAERDASSTYVNQRSEALVERLKRERFRAVFDYLRRTDRAPVINLLAVTEDTDFMDTIDPEVRADIEYAARILSKALARRDAGGGDPLVDTAGTAAGSRPGSAAGGAHSGRLAAVCAQSTAGEVDESGFLVLMEEVLERSRGLSRQYLLPMPTTERRKFEEPTFRPQIDCNSQLMAARRRPDGLPAHELLYETAAKIAAKKEAARRALEQKALAECRFRPELVAAPLAKEGRALRMAGSQPTSNRGTEGEEGAAQQQQLQGQGQGQGGSGGSRAEDSLVHIDALERQINDALVRLSLTGEEVAAHLAAQGKGPCAADAGTSAGAAVRQSLDYRALFGSPSPVELEAMGERYAASAPSGTSGYLTAAAVGDAGGDAGPTPESRPQPEAALEWSESGDALVANILSEQAEAAAAPPAQPAAAATVDALAGLDLAALAGPDVDVMQLEGPPSAELSAGSN